MISEEDLRQTAKSLLHEFVPDDFPFGKTAQALTDAELENNIRLSPYGYIMWAVDHYGYKCAYKNVLASDNVLKGYVDEAVKLKEDMPAMLLNAHTYVSKVLSNVPSLETCFKHLEGMTFPYVLYILFAGSEQGDVVSAYKPSLAEHMRRYPSMLDLLPESYRKVGEEVLNADA